MRDYFVQYYSCTHDAYHLTESRHFEDIIINGLIPKCGFRSRQIGDFKKRLYFFDSFQQIYFWKSALYYRYMWEDLMLLRFDVKDIRIYTFDKKIGDNAIECCIENTCIFCLKDSLKNELKKLNEEKEYRLEWNPLLELKK